MASRQLMVFYRQVQSLVDEPLQAVAVLEKAYYPVLVGMLGKAYIPKRVCYYFDCKFDVYPLLEAAYEQDPECDEYDSQDEQLGENVYGDSHTQVYTEWDIQTTEEIKKNYENKKAEEDRERFLPIVVYKAQGLELEAVKQDQAEILIEIIKKANDLLV